MIIRLHLDQFMPHDMLYARILQADGIEQPARALCDARQRVPVARVQRGPLKGKGAQNVDIVQLRKLAAISKGAAGRNDRIVQCPAAERNAHVYHTISPLSSTGPSLQMRLYPYFVSQLQPMHAPKPQAMRASKLNWPSRQRA